MNALTLDNQRINLCKKGGLVGDEKAAVYNEVND